MKNRTKIQIEAEARQAIPFLKTDMRCRLFADDVRDYVVAAVKEHAALLAVAEAAQHVLDVRDKLDTLSHQEKLDVVFSSMLLLHGKLTHLASVRSGKAVAS